MIRATIYFQTSYSRYTLTKQREFTLNSASVYRRSGQETRVASRKHDDTFFPFHELHILLIVAGMIDRCKGMEGEGKEG